MEICITGSGAAGWIAYHHLKHIPFITKIILIGSPKIPTIGVGESTLVDFANLRDYLGINEYDFMRGTNASYKMSIKFTDFYDKNYGSFHYPFKIPDLFNTNDGLYDWLDIKSFYSDTPVQDFVKCYFPNSFILVSSTLSLTLVKSERAISNPARSLPLYTLRLFVARLKNTSPLAPTFLSRKSVGLGIMRILSTIGAELITVPTYN